MKIIKRKTQKAIEKTLRKAIKKHGPAIAAGLASGIASSLATLASTDAAESRGQSNLGMLAQKVQEALSDQGKKITGKHEEKKTSRHRETPARSADPGADPIVAGRTM